MNISDLSDFSASESQRLWMNSKIKDFPQLGIINNPRLFLRKHREYVKKYFGEGYKRIEDFNRTEQAQKIIEERVKFNLGNARIIIGGMDRSGKSSIGICWLYWIMKNICNVETFNLQKSMFYGVRDERTLMRKAKANTCLFQDEKTEEGGRGINEDRRVSKNMGNVLAKSKIHKIRIKQEPDPRGLVSEKSEFVLLTWDLSNPRIIPPDEVIEIDETMHEKRDELKDLYIKASIDGSWDKYTDKKSDFKLFLNKEYGPILAKYFISTERVYRSILIIPQSNEPIFVGFVLNKVVPAEWLWAQYVASKEYFELLILTGEAFRAEFEYERNLIIHSEKFLDMCFNGKTNAFARTKIKSFVNAKLTGRSSPTIDAITDLIINVDIPEHFPNVHVK